MMISLWAVKKTARFLLFYDSSEVVKTCLDSGQTFFHTLKFNGKITLIACVLKNVYAVLYRNYTVSDNGSSYVVSACGSEEAGRTVNGSVFVKEVLWQENGKFVGLDHEIPLGPSGNGISLKDSIGLK